MREGFKLRLNFALGWAAGTGILSSVFFLSHNEFVRLMGGFLIIYVAMGVFDLLFRINYPVLFGIPLSFLTVEAMRYVFSTDIFVIYLISFIIIAIGAFLGGIMGAGDIIPLVFIPAALFGNSMLVLILGLGLVVSILSFKGKKRKVFVWELDEEKKFWYVPVAAVMSDGSTRRIKPNFEDPWSQLPGDQIIIEKNIPLATFIGLGIYFIYLVVFFSNI